MSFGIGMNERLRMTGRRMVNRLSLSGVIGLGAAIECGVAGRIVEASYVKKKSYLCKMK